MAEKPLQQSSKRKKRTETAAVIADLAGTSPRYVNMVMNGERENQDILDATIIYEEGKQRLLALVNELVPFPTKKAHQ